MQIRNENEIDEIFQFKILPHRPNVILGIENRVKKGLFP